MYFFIFGCVFPQPISQMLQFLNPSVTANTTQDTEHDEIHVAEAPVESFTPREANKKVCISVKTKTVCVGWYGQRKRMEK